MQTPESDLRKVAYTNRCKLTLADRSKLISFSSEPPEHELNKWILDHDPRESVTADQSSKVNQYCTQCSSLVHEGKPPSTRPVARNLRYRPPIFLMRMVKANPKAELRPGKGRSLQSKDAEMCTSQNTLLWLPVKPVSQTYKWMF